MTTTKKPRPRRSFPVHLMLNLEYDEGETSLTKKLSLPFVPFPGLFIESNVEVELDVQIDSVFWIENEGFRVICHQLSRPAWSYAEAKENAEREGWK